MMDTRNVFQRYKDKFDHAAFVAFSENDLKEIERLQSELSAVVNQPHSSLSEDHDFSPCEDASTICGVCGRPIDMRTREAGSVHADYIRRIGLLLKAIYQIIDVYRSINQ
jgi:hypothetical protein